MTTNRTLNSQKNGFLHGANPPFPNVFSRVKLEGSTSNYIYLLGPLIAHLLWQPQRGCYWIACGTSRGGEGLKIEMEKGFIIAGIISTPHLCPKQFQRGVSIFVTRLWLLRLLWFGLDLCCSASSILTSICETFFFF